MNFGKWCSDDLGWRRDVLCPNNVANVDVNMCQIYDG